MPTRLTGRIPSASLVIRKLIRSSEMFRTSNTWLWKRGDATHRRPASQKRPGIVHETSLYALCFGVHLVKDFAFPQAIKLLIVESLKRSGTCSALYPSWLLQLRYRRLCVQVPEGPERGPVHRGVWREWRREDRSSPNRLAVRGPRVGSKSGGQDHEGTPGASGTAFGR